MQPDDVLKCRIDLMKAYCDTAKSYVQLSTGAPCSSPRVYTSDIWEADWRARTRGTGSTVELDGLLELLSDQRRLRLALPVAGDSSRLG